MNIKKSKQQRSSISPCRTFDSSKQIEATSEEEFKSIFEKVSSSCFCISGDGEGSNHGADGGNRGGGSDDDRGGDGGNLGRDRCDINEELYDKAWKQFDTVSQRCILEVRCFFHHKEFFYKERFCFKFINAVNRERNQRGLRVQFIHQCGRVWHPMKII
ncbi:unnamed protein product [Dracunculus medinensis]|uniref:Uncharacterized protein n=1 Tax=Dracunculus medinensis TaxID=318479 RepID=A0A0N4U8H2_DRAME|nr:unnamed protein product [Dracunculus medinensis]